MIPLQTFALPGENERPVGAEWKSRAGLPLEDPPLRRNVRDPLICPTSTNFSPRV